MRFASPEFLYLLAIPLLLILLYSYSEWKTKRRMKKYATPRLFWRLVSSYSSLRKHLKFVLLLIVICLICLTLARPQFGIISEQRTTSGIEVVISIDVSNSMLATDVSPNRLERSKKIINNLVDRMSDDKVALNVFAGEAYPQMPITSDNTSVKLFLDNISTGMVTLQGTSIASAIQLAQHSFTNQKDVGKVIIIVTDGEDHEDGAVLAAQQAHEEGMTVYILGVGTQTGATIPTPYGPMTDNRGQVVKTTINTTFAQKIATAGGGKFYLVDNSNTSLQQLHEEISRLKHKESQTTYSTYSEQFIAVGILALILLLAEFFLLDIVHPIYKRFHLFESTLNQRER